jgi:hypothetical protein
MLDKHSARRYLSGILPVKLRGRFNEAMKLTILGVFLACTFPALGQNPLPALKDGTVIDEKTEFRHDGPLLIAGKVKLKGISPDLRGPTTLAPGAHLELDDVHIRVSDPPGSPNGTSGLLCDGPAEISIRHSSLTVEGSAHPIWRLKGDLAVDHFQTTNSEFHLDHVQAKLTDFTIFELEISHASHVVGKDLHLVFLSTHTGDNDTLEFSDIPADHAFSQKLRMGSLATADLTDTTAQLFLLYVHGSSHVSLNRIGRAQLAIAPTCQGILKLPHGNAGTHAVPMQVPEPNATNCPFRLRLSEVNADTWDVYAGGKADLTFTHSVIDELTAYGNARIVVRYSDIYADWLSLGGDAELLVEHSTVGAQRLASERPDLATSQARMSGHSHATFDHVNFDCGVVAAGDSITKIRDSVTPPNYIRRSGHAIIQTEPLLPVEEAGKGI